MDLGLGASTAEEEQSKQNGTSILVPHILSCCCNLRPAGLLLAGKFNESPEESSQVSFLTVRAEALLESILARSTASQ